MKVTLNGEPREFTDGLTLAALIAQLGMKQDRVAVELNLEIAPRSTWESTVIKNGDKLEIVHFVGGGSAQPESIHRKAHLPLLLKVLR
jgi:thiamine biosynthesis protein ThiS